MGDTIMAAFCLLILVTCVVVLTRIIMQELSKPKKSFMAYLGTAIQGVRGDESLINRYIEVTGDSRYGATSLYKILVTERFLKLLQEKYPGCKVLSQVCDINRKNCEFTYEVRAASGKVFILRFNSEDSHLTDHKDRLRFIANGFNITDYEFEKDKVNLIHSAEVVHSADQKIDDDDFLDLVDVFEEACVQQVQYPLEMLSPVRLQRLSRTPFGLQVTPYSRDIIPQDAEMINLAYREVQVEFHGEKHSLPMNDAVDWMTSALLAGENVYMFGQTGTGKTRLSEQLQLRLTQQERGANCIQVTTSMLQDIKSIGGLDAFINALSQSSEKGEKNILVFDEAESALEAGASGVHTELNSLMLQLLDGSIRRDLNLSCVLIFNAPPSSLNPIAFRRGRAGIIIELQALPKAQAEKFAKVLQSSNNVQNKVFDNKQFEKLADEANFLSNGVMYAGVNEITLADIYACFMDRDSRALLLDALRRKAGIEIPKREKKKVVPVSAPDDELSPAPVAAKAKTSDKEIAVEEELRAEPGPIKKYVSNNKKKNKKRRR
jgi:hypothetical protein